MSTHGYDGYIWRSGNPFTVETLAAQNTEFSDEVTGVDRSIMLLADFSSAKVRNTFSSQLAYWLSLGRRIGIVIPASLITEHSLAFHTAIAAAFNTSGCELPYSIAYRAFDIATGAQSITDVEMTEAGRLVYRSSIQGPVDEFPIALLKSIRCVRVIQFTPPLNPLDFFGDEDLFSVVINDISFHVLSDTFALRHLYEIRTSPKILLFNHFGDQSSLMDAFAVWAGEARVAKLTFTGVFDEEVLYNDINLREEIKKAFPYLHRL